MEEGSRGLAGRVQGRGGQWVGAGRDGGGSGPRTGAGVWPGEEGVDGGAGRGAWPGVVDADAYRVLLPHCLLLRPAAPVPPPVRPRVSR
jgi:hypothetical protein